MKPWPRLEAAIPDDPILEVHLVAIEAILETAGEGDDTDGDGISDEAETAITGQIGGGLRQDDPGWNRRDRTRPDEPGVGWWPSQNLRTANSMVGAQASVATTTTVAAENQAKLRAQEESGLEFLLTAADCRNVGDRHSRSSPHRWEQVRRTQRGL